jgi:hypothetical protein
MIIPCYFCQTPLNFYEPAILHQDCGQCDQRPKICQATTTHEFEKKVVIYAHLFVSEKWQENNFNNKFLYEAYHIRWSLQNKTTTISHRGNPILTVSGFPFTIDNAPEKLKLYLTFL